jgi:RNA polymerase sigma-54 factor
MIHQRLEHLQQQKLSYHQVLLMRMLLDTKLEFEQRLNQELEENPALELNESDNKEDENDAEAPEILEKNTDDFDIEYFDQDEPAYKSYANNLGADDEFYEKPVVAGKTFQQQLKEQLDLQKTDGIKKKIAEYLIDCLDENGYMRIALSQIVDDLAFREGLDVDEKILEESLMLIQNCEPPGVGARDVRECLLLQLKRKKDKDPSFKMAQKILTENFDDLILKNYKKIMSHQNLSSGELNTAITHITHLYPHPVFPSYQNEDATNYIIPDFTLQSSEEEFTVTLNTKNEPELRINKKFMEQLEQIHKAKKDLRTHHQKETLKFIRNKIESARAFIDAVKLRQRTLLKVVNAIVEKQQEYLREGDIKKLKPMVLKDVAQSTGMEISTVSRITSSKYIQTPYGNFLLKEFFSEGLRKDDGEEASNKEIKKIISEIIGSEDKQNPLTDIEVSAELKKTGYNVARRTVTKYREAMRIPIAKMRKDWK